MVEEGFSLFSFNDHSSHVGDVEDSAIVPDMLTFWDYAFEPDGKIITSIFDDIPAFPVELIHVRLLRQGS